MKIITLHNKDSTDFLNNNGIGVLTEFSSSPSIKEALNGEFYLEFEYIADGKYSSDLVEENIIVSPVGYGDRQAFRISKTKKIISDAKECIYVYAKHISYDLADNWIEDSYIQDKSGDGAISWLLSHTQYSHRFEGYSDIFKTNSARYVQKNPIQAILGEDDNSFVNRWGGEILRNNFNISMLQQRGSNKGVSIRYRKNLKGIEFETDFSNIVTRGMPKGYDGMLLPERYVDSPIINHYSHPKIDSFEYSDIKVRENESSEGFENLEACYTEMRKRVNQEFSNGIDKPIISARVDFIELSKTIQYEEYKNLEKLCIGDSVNIYIEEFDLDVTEKVISTVYDPLLEKYTQFELGQPFNSYMLENKSNTKRLEEEIIPSFLDEAKSEATKKLTTALGGYVTKTRNELFIADDENINQAEKIWRWNLNGLGYSKSGVNGNYGLAITMDGEIVADYIKTGTLKSLRIENGNDFSVDQSGYLITRVGKIGGFMLTQNKLYKNYIDNNVEYQSGMYIPDSAKSNTIFLYAGFPTDAQSLSQSNVFLQHGGCLNFRSGYLNMIYEPTINEDGSSSWQNALSMRSNGNWRYLSNGYTWSYEGISFVDGSPYSQSTWLYSAVALDIMDGTHSQMMLRFLKYDPNNSGDNNRGHALYLYSDVFITGSDMGGTPHKLTVNGEITSGGNSVILSINSDSNKSRVSYISRGYNVNTGETTAITFQIPFNNTTYHVTGTTYSDIRLKENITDTEIDSAIEIIKKIILHAFDFKDKKIHKKIGFIAQELEKIDPDFVSIVDYPGSDLKEMRILNEKAMMPYVIKALQEAIKRIEVIERKIV